MKRFELFFSAILVPLDYLMLLLAAMAAYFLRFRSGLVEVRPVTHLIPFGEFAGMAFVISLGWIIIFALSGLYKIKRRKFTEEFLQTIFACSASMMATVALVFFKREFFASRFIVLASWGLSIWFVSLGRISVRYIKKLLHRFGLGVQRVIIIGKDNIGAGLAKNFLNKPDLGYNIIEWVDGLGDDILARISDLRFKNQLDCVIFSDPYSKREDTFKLLSLCQENHLDFKYPADFFAAYLPNLEIDTVAGIPIVEVKRTRLDGWGKIYKRIFDLVGSLFLVFLTSPLMFLVALAIGLDSRGPVFWRKLDDGSLVKRIGEGGNAFNYFKFRSMAPGTHALRYSGLSNLNTRLNSPLVKIKNDPRITRVGKFIRRFSLDELPELFLVLSGKMSLVGPRPHLPEEVVKYNREHKRVLGIKPGMTGLSQISGRADLSFEEEVRLDAYYMENWSLGLDLYILLKTPFVVLQRKGAY